MNNVVTTLGSSFLIGIFFILAGNKYTHKISDGLKFSQIRPWTVELATLEHLEKFPKTDNGRNVVTTLAPSFLNGSSSFLQIRRTTIKAWMSLIFVKIPSPIMVLAPLEHLKSLWIML